VPAHREERLWWFPTLQTYWLESGDAAADYAVVKAHPDAVYVARPDLVDDIAMHALRRDARKRLMAAQKEARDA
jgi:hypothetical protein